MPRFGFLGAQSLGVKLPGAFESFQREAFGGETPSGHEAGALAQSAFEALPGFLVEFAGHAERVLSQLRVVRFECGPQMCSDRVGFRNDLPYPLVPTLRSAKPP